MFGRLKERFGRKKQPTVSYNQREAHERCVQRILRIHYMAIVTSGEERERGLEDAVINPMAFAWATCHASSLLPCTRLGVYS